MSNIISEAIEGVIDGGANLVNAVGDQVNKKQELQNELETTAINASMQVDVAQTTTNTAEANSSIFFNSGWRPAVGWICVSGLAYQFLFRSIIGWLGENTLHWTYPPSLDTGTLITLLGGMLGLSTHRMIEKIKGVAS